MVYSGQWGAVRPTGLKKKKGLMAPIIEEQAKQGIATRMVTDAKARKQKDAEWEFQKQSKQQELDLQRQSLAQQEEFNAHQKTMGYVSAGIGAISTGLEAIDYMSEWFK